MRHRPILVATTMALLALAGCADSSEGGEDPAGGDVTADTGAVRGVVVDETITPVQEAEVSLQSGESTLTDEKGEFTFGRLDPGTYFVQVEKPGYEGAQSSVTVEAGDGDPPALNIQIVRIPGADPYLEPLQFDGFYECAYAIVVQTDSCDWVVRTIHDEGVDAVPRGIQDNRNTDYIFLPNATQTIIQEGFFDTREVPEFRFSVAAAPIDNACDCSQVYLESISDTGYAYGRLDKADGVWPDTGQEFAVRGFIPFQDAATDVAYGVNIEFQIFTTLFHHYEPEPGWNFQEKDQFRDP